MRGRYLSVLFVLAGCGDNVVDIPGDADVPASPPKIQAPTSLTVVEGETATFSVRLAEPPRESVTIRVASTSDISATARPSEIVLDGEHTVAEVAVVTTEDDDNVINETAEIVLSIDEGPSHRVMTRVIDNDVQQIVTDATNLAVSEAGTGAFSVRLARRPSEPVTVAVWSDAPELATASPATLTFDPARYNQPVTVTVIGVADADTADGAAHVFAGQLPNVTDARIDVAVTDDDVQALVLSATNVVLSEGADATFTVALAFDPLGTANVSVDSSDPLAVAVTGSQFLQFNSGNYNVPQTVTLAALEDGDQTNEAATLTLSGAASRTVSVPVIDNDSISVVEASSVREGQTGTFYVSVANDPGPAGLVVTAEVISGDVTISPSTQSFTSANWQYSSRDFFVSASIDPYANANRTALIRFSAPGQTPRDVPITIYDRIPGTLYNVDLTHEHPVAGAPGFMDVMFMPSNGWPSDARLLIDFPPEFDVSAAVLGSSSASGSLSITSTGSTITVDRSNGTVDPASITLRLYGVRNPTVSGTYTIALETRTAGGAPIDTGGHSYVVWPAMLQDATVTFTTLQPGATGDVTIAFKTQNPWPADGTVVIGFPFELGVSAATFVSQTGATGTFTASVVSNRITLTRSGGTALPAGAAVSITIANITNPATSQALDAFDITTTSASTAMIDRAFPRGVTIGCPASMTKLAHVGSNVPRGGTPWQNPNGVTDPYTNNGAWIQSFDTTDYLVARDFQFSVPAGAAITGIRFDLWHDTRNWPVIDDAIRVIKGGTIGASDRSATSTWLSFDDVSYGSATDLWGDSWAAADVESSSFGVALAARAVTPGMPGYVALSRVSATVYLSCP